MNRRWLNARVALALLMTAPLPSLAGREVDTEALRAQVRVLQQQLASQQQLLKQLNARLEQQESANKDKLAALGNQVEAANSYHDEWLNSNLHFNVVGSAAVGYTDAHNNHSKFSRAEFAPIFQAGYKDLLLLQSEVEFNDLQDGGTNTELETANLSLFLNDYATLIAGKFLSPVGQFQQNLHPAWINKLPSRPPGFGEDGASPLSEVGVQVRGGLPTLAGIRSNYALYVANGPDLHAKIEGGVTSLEAVEAEGRTSDNDGRKVFGGRLGLRPIPSLEVGVSGATGEARVTLLINDAAGTRTDVTGDANHDYTVFGSDFTWQWRNLDLRGEFLRTRIGGQGGSIAPKGDKWQSWYTQAAYKFFNDKVEGVVRFGDFDSPAADLDQRQWTLGLNYLLGPNLIAKVAYAINSGRNASSVSDNALEAQLAFGF